MNCPGVCKNSCPPDTKLLDHFQAVALWNALQVEAPKRRLADQLAQTCTDPNQVQILFKQFSDDLEGIIDQRITYALDTKKHLVEQQKTISQIIEGSTIPTFVINKDHIVTHWNPACEKADRLCSRRNRGDQ